EAGRVQTVERIAGARVRIAALHETDARTFRVGTGDVAVACARDAEAGGEGRAGGRLGDAGPLPPVGNHAGQRVAELQFRGGVNPVRDEDLTAIEAGRAVVRQSLELVNAN